MCDIGLANLGEPRLGNIEFLEAASFSKWPTLWYIRWCYWLFESANNPLEGGLCIGVIIVSSGRLYVSHKYRLTVIYTVAGLSLANLVTDWGSIGECVADWGIIGVSVDVGVGITWSQQCGHRRDSREVICDFMAHNPVIIHWALCKGYPPHVDSRDMLL